MIMCLNEPCPQWWHEALPSVAMLSFFLCWIAIIILRFTLDRRVRKALPSDKVYDMIHDSYFGLGRVIGFALSSIFEFPKKSPIMIYHYDNFDVKGFANRFEKFWAWAMVLGLGIFLLLAAIYSHMDWLGLWPN